MEFRLTTWNVNGIRNPFGYQPWREKRTFQAMFDILEADIVVMQETKIQRKDLKDDMVLVPGWDVFFSLPMHKKGYSGVAIYTRNATCAPIKAEEGITGILCPPKSDTRYRDLPQDQRIGGYPRPGQLSGTVDEATLDSEGRCVILEFPAFVLLGVYSPANRDSTRTDFRVGYLEALDVRIRNLVAEGKQVILTGDLNVARSPRDITNLAEGLRKEGMTVDDWLALPSRRTFNQLLFEGEVSGPRDEGREDSVLWDMCRCFHPDREGMNTCWDTKRNTRPANNGSRIDYVLCSDGLKDWITSADIQPGLMGSDHCPVYVTFADTVMPKGRDSPTHLSDVMNPPGMFRDGKRLREWATKDLCSLSAKLIPEFDRRQSIRDMFTKKPGPSVARQTYSGGDAGLEPIEEPTDLPGSTHGDESTATPPPIPEDAASQPYFGVASTNSAAFLSPNKTAGSKRAAESTEKVDAASKAQRRGKASTDPALLKARTSSGQQTLAGFFKAKPSPTSATATKTATPPHPAAKERFFSPSKTPARPSLLGGTEASTTDEQIQLLSTDKQTSVEPPSAPADEKVFDPIEAKESWSKLLGKRVVPRCVEHDEPCISLLTKKPGVNCGRSFYICPRPLGPSGEKERGTEWRCSTFIWSSDWNGRAQ